MDLERLLKEYDALLASSGGDRGEAFNQTEYASAGNVGGPIRGLSADELAQLNRIAQSADVPATALLSVPYEGLKAMEQYTGIPALTLTSKALNSAGIPVALPDATTSPASVGNVVASLAGLTRSTRLGKTLGELLRGAQ